MYRQETRLAFMTLILAGAESSIMIMLWSVVNLLGKTWQELNSPTGINLCFGKEMAANFMTIEIR